MTPRFRMIAGPNGSGKTTLYRLLTGAYAVNFYTFLNADDMLAEARANGTLPEWFLKHVPYKEGKV